MKKKLQIFISSTYTDMLDERQAAVEAVLSSGHIPAGMELFTSGDESQLNVIKRWIDESDVYLLILGGRYGSIETNSGKSYIQLEYEYALKTKKPFFSIVIKESALDEKVKIRGRNVLELVNQQKYSEFYKKVTSKICSFYEDIKDIKIAIYNKISEYVINPNFYGWISGKEIRSTENYADEIIKLNNENKQIKTRNETLDKRINELTMQLKEKSKLEYKNQSMIRGEKIENRVNRVLTLLEAEFQDTSYDGYLSWVEDEKSEYKLPEAKGNFSYYYIYESDKKTTKSDEPISKDIDYLLIISIDISSMQNIEGSLADIRLMLENQKKVGGTMVYKFVIASLQINDDMEERYNAFISTLLKKLKLTKKNYSFEFWNDKKLSAIEEKLGLKVPGLIYKERLDI